VWTVIGCLGALVLVLLGDPATLKDLPDIPQGFLYLMGVSTAGYLGGKLVHLPGPVIRQIFASGTERAPGDSRPAIKISLKGDNLSRNGTVKVDGDALRADEFRFVDGVREDGSSDPSLCSAVDLVLLEGDRFLQGTHRLIVTNPDGQMVEAEFPIDPLTVQPFQLKEGDTKVDVAVTGANFTGELLATWRPPGARDEQQVAVSRTSDTRLTVSLIPGPRGVGRFKLQAESGLFTSLDVVVA